MGVVENRVRRGRRGLRPTLNEMLSYGLYLSKVDLIKVAGSKIDF